MSQNAAFRKSLLGAVILGLASLFLAVSDARAGTLIINVSDGTTSYDIFDQLPPDTLVGPGDINRIQADVSGLTFTDFKLIGLNASSDNPGAQNPDGATLIVGGEVQRITAGGPATLTITTYQTGYTLPSGSPLTLTSTTSSTYTNAPSVSQTFESWYNPTSPATPPPPFGTPAPLITVPLAGTGQGGGQTMLMGLPGSPSFSLTNQIVLTIGGEVGGHPPDVVFGGSTQLLSAVPEPTSVIMLGTAAPLALILMSRIRRLRKAAA